MASSALTGKLETYVETKASAKKHHDMLCNRPHHVHHSCSEKIQACDLHEGDWGTVGSVICWNYVHDGKAKIGKEVIEATDSENNSITFRLIEGDLLEEYKSFVIKFQASPKSGGEGSMVHWTFEYEKLHEGIAHPETLIQLFIEISTDMDAYLLKEN